MSTLIILGFDGLRTADEVLDKLRTLQKEYLIDLEDACVIERDAAGKVYLKQALDMMKLGAQAGGLRGALLGTFLGLLFLNPLAGMALGAVAGTGFGALSGSMIDFGIPDDFMKKLGSTIPAGSSALAIAFRSATEDKVLPELAPYHPRVLKTSLSEQAEKQLSSALTPAPAAAE